MSFITDAVPGVPVRAAHVVALRAELDPALRALSFAAPGYSEAVAPGGLIKAMHIEELRARVR